MNIDLQIKKQYEKLSPVNKRISDFILNNRDSFLKHNALEIAELCNTSNASIIRYVKMLGFNGLADFKIQLAKQEKKDSLVLDTIITSEDKTEVLCNKVFNLVNTANSELYDNLDFGNIDLAVNYLVSAKKIYILGIGASSLPAYNMYHLFNRVNKHAFFNFDAHMAIEFVNYASEADVIIAFSYSGESSEIIYPVEIAKENHAKVIAITRERVSSLSNLADVTLYVPDQEHTSRMAALTSVQTSMTLSTILYLKTIQNDLDIAQEGLIKTRELVSKMKYTKMEK